jgi:hypothetical protein
VITRWEIAKLRETRALCPPDGLILEGAMSRCLPHCTADRLLETSKVDFQRGISNPQTRLVDSIPRTGGTGWESK